MKAKNEIGKPYREGVENILPRDMEAQPGGLHRPNKYEKGSLSVADIGGWQKADTLGAMEEECPVQSAAS